MKKMISIFIILLTFSLTVVSYATTYHVRKDGHNTNCNGAAAAAAAAAPNCAFLTIQKGINTATTAGDIVNIHAGSYFAEGALTTAASGSVGNLITIQAAVGDTPSIARITVSHNYIVVRGFLITASGNYLNSGVHVTGSNNQVLYNTINGTSRGDASAVGVKLIGNNNSVSYNTFDGLSNNVDTSFCMAIGFSGNNNEATYNLIKDTFAIERVFEMFGNHNRIANNEVRNVQSSIELVPGSHPDIFQTWNNVGDGVTSHDWIVENNYIHDFAGQIGNMGIEHSYDQWTGWVFRNNIFANIPGDFCNYFIISFYNNLFYRCSTADSQSGPLRAQVAQAGFIGRNNAFIACGWNANNVGWYTERSNNDMDYNFISNTDTGGTKRDFGYYYPEANGINGGNPKLVAPYSDCIKNVCDFHLQRDSPLIDKGMTLTGFSFDKDGITRPHGYGWDIGAYEYNLLEPPLRLRIKTN